MQVHRKRRQKRGHPILAAVILLALVSGASYGGATLWQGLQDSFSSTQKEEDPAERDIIGAQAEVVPPAAPPVGASGSRSSAPKDEGEVSPDPLTPYTADRQVKASAQVELSYFDDAVFFGDSVSTGLEGYHIVDNAACYAAVGVSPHTALTVEYIGASVADKKTLLEAAKEAGDRGKVYIMLGGNGLWQEKDAFIADYGAFLDAVIKQYPNATVYIQSMTPVGINVGETYVNISREKVIEYNAAIAELSAKYNLPFLNLFETLMDEEGYLPEEVSPDGLHLTPEYYYRWLDYLRTHTVSQ
ncbi:MAG: GDSL-type esterase/lipase family protein [Oscillospiraceae bacterium]|jgi:lysophospholipase L1-like esterase|nr:GDSL-type esterase/lipase family protein [Oscillospiraceae bacterium]